MGEEVYKYHAFISYNSEDYRWGKRLHRRLENYRMPTTLCSERGWERNPLRPVFYAPADIQPGDLNEELKRRLQMSRYLIVICSPRSAQSEWVGKEINYFCKLGRKDNILLFIVDGIPNSGDPNTECFHPMLKQLGLDNLLGVNIHEKNVSRYPWVTKEHAYVQLITKLLGIEFDTLWKRHKRLLIEKAVKWTVGIVVAVGLSIWATFHYTQPFDAKVELREASVHNGELPPLENATVTIRLDNEEKTDTIASLADSSFFSNIPRRFMGENVEVSIRGYGYNAVDTVIAMGENLVIPISRDSLLYGNVDFLLWDSGEERAVRNSQVKVGGYSVESDSDGRVRVYVPLDKQRVSYKIETPTGKSETLLMPCSDNSVVDVNR